MGTNAPAPKADHRRRWSALLKADHRRRWSAPLKADHRRRWSAPLLIVLAALAAAAQDTTFRTTVPVVLVPATVTDKHGTYVNGLTVDDFELRDDGHPRKILLDTSDTVAIPLAALILVQANSTAPTAILKVQKVGAMIQPLITGARGHAALLAYGSEISTVQDFTNDPDQLTQAFRDIRPQPGKMARMIDAVTHSANLFADRPTNEHRVVFVIGESRDRGSKTKLKDAIKALQLEGVTVFPIVYSAYVTPFTTKASDMPAPGDPDLLGAITEPARLLGKVNAAHELAQSSGGRNTSFATLDGLEKILTNLGEELHSEYLISYTNETCSPGYHQIEVRLKSHAGLTVRARPGYWTDQHACRASTH